ncbi:MAG: exosortase C-terminal domain/associated protein EpsI [Candidatus Zixiibacteriota bacterium]
MKSQYFLVIGILIVGGFFGNLLRFSANMPERGPDFNLIPNEVGGYWGEEKFFTEEVYEILNADTTTYRDFVSSTGARAGLFIAYFKSQRFGGSVHSPKHCLPGGGWRIEKISPLEVELPGRPSMVINNMLIASKSHSSVVLYWYQSRMGIFRNEYMLLLDRARNSLLLRPNDIAIVRLTVDAPDGDIDAAARRGVALLKELHPYLQQALPFGSSGA